MIFTEDLLTKEFHAGAEINIRSIVSYFSRKLCGKLNFRNNGKPKINQINNEGYFRALSHSQSEYRQF